MPTRTIQAAILCIFQKWRRSTKILVGGRRISDISTNVGWKGYLESVPIPPQELKAIFPNAIDHLKSLILLRTLLGVKQLGGYTFIKHSAVDGEKLIVGLVGYIYSTYWLLGSISTFIYRL